MKKLTIILALLLLTACSSDDKNTVIVVTPERISFSGGVMGIFDPSVTRDPGTGRLWMSYSAVDPSGYVLYTPDIYWSVGTRLAFSDDNGVTWQDAGVSVAAFTEPIVGPMTVTNPAPAILAGSMGIWQSETSSLIYDPNANPNEEWKLIWFQYLNANLENYFLDYSWIAIRTAATPLGLAAAPTVKLFGGFGIQLEGQNTASPVFSPTGGQPAIQLNSGITNAVGGANTADLTNCVFAEPGLHATATAVYMAIFCVDVSIPEELIVYFRCLSPCTMTNAANWEYVGKLLTPADALAATGRDHYQAPAMVEQNGKTYLIVTPVDTTVGNRYDGCRVYEFTDIDTNVLARDMGGDLIEVQRVNGMAGSHNGACAAFDGLQGGIIFSQHEPTNTPETFRTYKSQVSIP